jgi:Ca-activated chloride channel family protein
MPRRNHCAKPLNCYNIMAKYLFVILLVMPAAWAAAQSAHSELKQGDKHYQAKDFATAEEHYRKALEKQQSAKGHYNLGNSVYKQGNRYDSAVEQYEKAADEAKSGEAKSMAYYNLGNSFFKKGKYKESVDAYKNALRLNPNDQDAKKNLQLTKMLLQQQQQQNQQNQQQQDNQQQQNNQQQNNQDQQPAQSPQQGQQNEQDQQPQQNQNQNDPNNQQQQQQQLNKDEAQKLLRIMDEEERKVQEKMRKAQQGPATNPDKDW